MDRFHVASRRVSWNRFFNLFLMMMTTIMVMIWWRDVSFCSCYTFIWKKKTSCARGATRCPGDETTTKRKSRRRAFTAHLQDRHLLPPRVFFFFFFSSLYNCRPIASFAWQFPTLSSKHATFNRLPLKNIIIFFFCCFERDERPSLNHKRRTFYPLLYFSMKTRKKKKEKQLDSMPRDAQNAQ